MNEKVKKKLECLRALNKADVALDKVGSFGEHRKLLTELFDILVQENWVNFEAAPQRQSQLLVKVYNNLGPKLIALDRISSAEQTHRDGMGRYTLRDSNGEHLGFLDFRQDPESAEEIVSMLTGGKYSLSNPSMKVLVKGPKTEDSEPETA